MPMWVWIILILGGIGTAVALIQFVYMMFNHGQWKERYSPNQNAIIIGINSESVSLANRYFRKKLKTKVRFNDGYIFITYKTKYETTAVGLNYTRYQMSVDADEIITKAKKAHEKAVERKLSSKSNK